MTLRKHYKPTARTRRLVIAIDGDKKNETAPKKKYKAYYRGGSDKYTLDFQGKEIEFERLVPKVVDEELAVFLSSCSWSSIFSITKEA